MSTRASRSSFVGDRLKILDIDIENRPLAYLGQDFTTAEITAIAAGWADAPRSIRVWLLGVETTRGTTQGMLADFLKLYNEADMVTGHYIRMHDLPVINGALLEHGFGPLPDKLTSDTKLDLVRMKHLSGSQENLAEALGIPASKFHMSNTKWREANRLTRDGIELTRKRVASDVAQHMQLRKALVARGLLGAPKMWRS